MLRLPIIMLRPLSKPFLIQHPELDCLLSFNIQPTPQLLFMSKLKIPLHCFLLLMSWTAFAQPKTITGYITDPEGKPLSNVTVQVQNSNVGTSSDATGQFTIQVPNS